MGNQTLGKYATIQKLGKGIYGKTRLSQSADNYLLAIKIYQVINWKHLDQVIHKVKNYLNFQSKFTVNIRDIFPLDQIRFAVAIDYQPQGNLAQNLKFKTIQQTLLSMKQLALALQFLHLHRKIPHNNIKPQNIIVKDQNLLLSDIGCPLTGLIRLRKILGGYDYRSPQSFQERGGSFQGDIWSLGLVFLEMVLGKRIRQVEKLEGIQCPSLVRQQYPSNSILDSILDQDIRYLIGRMLLRSPIQRMDIKQVIQFISHMLSTLKSPQVLDTPVRQLEQQQQVHYIQQFVFTFDRQHPSYHKFRLIKNKVCRVDNDPKRYQIVARQCIPAGKWKVTFRILNYGRNNEAVVFGILAEERRKEPMSGDVDQYHSVAIWSNKTNQQSNLCLNGVWDSYPLPCIREKEGLLQLVVDTIGRNIQWWLDGQCIAESSLAQGFWSQEYYVFLGLKGQNCQVQVGQQNDYR